MSDPTFEFSSIKRKFDNLADSARMTNVNEELTRVATVIRGFPGDIEKLRSRGYAFGSYLEKKAEVLQQQWEDIRTRVEQLVDQEAEDLRDELSRAEAQIAKAGKLEDTPEKLGKVLPNVESAVETLEEKVRAAESRIDEIFGSVPGDVSAMSSQISKFNWYVDQKDEATFDWLAGESVFLAAKAEWVATGKSRKDPDGILFLTDQRMIFEQRETEGKKLGLFGGKKVQEVEWEFPLHQVESVTAEKKGMLGGIDLINMTLGSGAPHAEIVVEVKGGVDCKFWAKQIERMMRGDTDDERAIEPDPELLEAIREAPSQCHVCGGTLPMLTAGQLQIECQYCGTIIRI